MRLIIGLGNPGAKYQNNRHNAGHMFIDYIMKGLRMTDDGLKAVKTDCYMNQSGSFVKKLIRNSQSAIDELIIIHDDLDIPLGKFKIQLGEGPKLHNGIASIENTLRTKKFWRVRIGVDNRPPAGAPENRIDGETYVLQDFSLEERQTLFDLFPKIYDKVIAI